MSTTLPLLLPVCHWLQELASATGPTPLHTLGRWRHTRAHADCQLQFHRATDL